MKPGELPRGELPTRYTELFRRLDRHLKASATRFEAAPFLSLLFEQLANGARPNVLFAWEPREAGERLDPYYRALLDAYLDHLVHADVAASDAQLANQLLQDILDGAEPDRVLGYEAAQHVSRVADTRARRVVYAYRMLLERNAVARTEVHGGGDPFRGEARDAAIARVAEHCNVGHDVVEAAYADPEILAEAAKLFERQSGLTPEMHAVATREGASRDASSDQALAHEYASVWKKRHQRDG